MMNGQVHHQPVRDVVKKSTSLMYANGMMILLKRGKYRVHIVDIGLDTLENGIMVYKEIQQKLARIINHAEKIQFNFTKWFRDKNINNTIKNKKRMIEYISYNELYKLLLIDHDFCKALWGTGTVCHYCGSSEVKPIVDNPSFAVCEDCVEYGYLIESWEYYLSVAVMKKDMLQYVYDTIKE